LSRAQRAGIRCGEGAFSKFLFERYPRWAAHDAMSKYDPAATLRRICAVASRKELDTDETAGDLFDRLDTEYQAWFGL
jgi:hypothetical protein